MTPGKPLTAIEKRVIEEMHETTFPAIIADHLGRVYTEENGGYRSPETVRRYIRELYRPKRGRSKKEEKV